MNYDTDLDEFKLKQFRIHELRDLARKIGVKSPTSQNKDELIEKVLKIISGESAPYVKQTAKGRPSRSASQLNNLVDYFLPENANLETLEFLNVNDDNKFNFFAEMPEFDFDTTKSEQSVVQGYLDVTTSGYGIIRVNGFGISDNDVYVHKIYVAKYGLVSGDYLLANAKQVYNNRPRVVTEILEINNGNLKSEIKFDDLKKCETSNTFTLLNEKITLGNSSVILSDNKVMFNEAKQLAGNITNAKVIVVAPSKDEQSLLESKNFVLSPFSVTKGYLNVYSNLKLAILKAKNLAEQNNVIIVINGINYYYRALTALISESENNTFKIEETVKLELTKILLSSKATQNSSLSVVFYESNKLEQKLLDFVKFDVGTLADNTFQFEDDKLIRI